MSAASRRKRAPGRATAPIWWLVIVASAAVASFVASTAIAERRAARIDELAANLSRSAASSIERLTLARGELHALSSGMRTAVRESAAGGSADLDAIVRSNKQLQKSLESYLEVPAFPGERSIYSASPAADVALRGATRRLLDRLRAHDVTSAVALRDAEFTPAASALDELIERLVAFNAAQIVTIGAEMLSTRRHAMLWALSIDGLAGVLALATLVVVARTAQSYLGVVGENARLANARAEELERFAGRAAHDLKNPLSVIGLHVAVAAREGSQGPRAREALEKIGQQVSRTARLVDGLLEFARSGAQPTGDARADVGAVVDGVVAELAPLAEAAHAEMRLETGPPVVVACSPGALASALSNLVGNALKFLVEGAGTERWVSVRVMATSERVRIDVEDTGPGLPPELGERIFDPFVRGPQTGQPGTGLGLSTVKRIVEAHRGRVGAEAREENGSRFWIELPRAPR